MKKCLIVLLIALVQLGAKAATAEALIVKFKDNSSVQFILNESPKIKFVSDSIAISSSTLTGKYAYDGIRNLHFENVEITSVKSTKVEENTLRVIMTARNEYTLNGLNPTDKVLVYSISGQVVSTLKPTNSNVKVSLEGLSSGTYIINAAGKHAFKVVKK